METGKEAEARWKPGEVAWHRLAKGLVLEVREVLPDGKHVKAMVLRKGETGLWEGHVLTFRTEHLTPVNA
jgi:hypothetical protein